MQISEKALNQIIQTTEKRRDSFIDRTRSNRCDPYKVVGDPEQKIGGDVDIMHEIGSLYNLILLLAAEVQKLQKEHNG